MKNLEEINHFGANAAEDDSLLVRCFQSHPIFQKVLPDEHFLILGRKGSGKTAICKEIMRLREKQDDILSVEYDFTRYPWDYHKLMVVASDAEQERYLHSWRYLILLSLAKILLNLDRSQPNSDTLNKIKQFVIDTYGSVDPDITKIFEPGKQIKGLKSLGISVMGTGGQVEVDKLEMKNLPRMFQDVNSTLQRLIIESLNPTYHYYVCFDGLDIGFKPGSLEYQQRLIGLILAARDFTKAGLDSDHSLKVLIFLRSDIYKNYLFFEDKNKITRTYALEIEWDKPYQGVTLKSMMERRFAEVLEINTDGAWEQIFDESEGMGVHPTKYAYVLDHTFLRPRDMIEFCNCTLNVYKHRLKDKNELAQQNKFSSEDIYSARLEYSEYLYNEIVDEIYQQYPDYAVYFEILRSIGYQLFSRAAFFEAYELWKERLKPLKPADEILEHLFEISVIGFARDLADGLSKARYIFRYMDSTAHFNRFYEHFSVHWGLTGFLELKRDQPSKGFVSIDPNISGNITVTVLDANNSPTSILSTTMPGKLRVNWSVSGATVLALEGDWQVSAYLESIGPGSERTISPVSVPMKSGVYSSIPYPSFSYKLDISLPDGIPAGLYKLVIVIAFVLPDGVTRPIVGYNEDQLLQFYSASQDIL